MYSCYRFPKAIEDTSSHRFRASDDMCYPYAYYYFVNEATRTPNATEILFAFDENRDGMIDFLELGVLERMLSTAISGVVSKTKLRKELDACLLLSEIKQFCPACSSACKTISELLSSISNNYSSYPYVVASQKDFDDILYEPIKGSLNKIRQILRSVENADFKFLCLQDGLNHERDDILESITTYGDGLQRLFPKPSPFENEILQKKRNYMIRRSPKIGSLSKSFPKNQHDSLRNELFLILTLCFAVCGYLIFLVKKRKFGGRPRKNNTWRRYIALKC